MNRPISPIRHDYKPADRPDARRKRRWPWFVAGAGLPLVAISVLLARDPRPDDASLEASATAVSRSVPGTGGDSAPAAEKSTATESPVAEPDASLPPPAADDVPVSADASLDEPQFRPPLALPPAHDRLQLTVKRGDTLDRLFRRNGLSIGDLAEMVALPEAAPHLKKLIPGDELTIEHDDGRLVSLYRELDLTSALRIDRNDSGFVAKILDRPIEVRRRRAHGRIDTSLFESAIAAGLSDRLVMNLAGIFAWDVDFVLDIRSGDDYYILYEQIFQDGEFVRDGDIIAAEFNNNGRTIQAIRYIDKNGRADYFTPDGRSVRKAFVRAPVDFSRISSNFNPNRRHPILNTIRAHQGVDYAAPKGTPIKAAGDGKIIFRGTKGGYGRTIILQHGGNITTLYAHMNAFDRNVHLGSRVVQGQVIGYVGMTGLATAPHLHYEYRLNGVHRNPRTVKLPQAAPIADEYRDDFLASVPPILDELLQSAPTQVAVVADD